MNSDITQMVDLGEIKHFYTSPETLIDNGNLNSFSLIRSIIEVLDYYGVKTFTAEDVHRIFSEIHMVQKSNGRIFCPSVKKITGVLECYTVKGKYSLSEENGVFRIESWDHTGYRSEIEYAKINGKI